MSEEAQAVLDRLVAFGARLFDVPVATVSLIDAHRETIQADVGIGPVKAAPDLSLCRYVVESGDMIVVPDLTQDARFADLDNVVHKPHLRFYASAPLRSQGGRCFGTLCLLDFKPRQDLSQHERAHLTDLAALAADRLERDQDDGGRGEGMSPFEHMAIASPNAIICVDSEGKIAFWNNAAEHLFGYSESEVLYRGLDLIVPPDLQRRHARGLKRVAEGKAPRSMLGRTVEVEARRRDGSRFPIAMSLSMWRDDGKPSFGAVIRDISERRLNEVRLSHMAWHDTLTGLPNRAGLLSRIAPAVGRNTPGALVMIDVADFKEINVTRGQSAGDRVLRLTGDCIAGCLRKQDTVARWGGDEFCVYLPNLTKVDRINALCDRMMSKLRHIDIESDSESMEINVNMGIALFPDDADDAEGLIANADLALYHAKQESAQRCFFAPWLRRHAVARRRYESRLRDALDLEQFEMFYQPQFRVSDGRLVGAEALIRWRHPEDGLVMPAIFLPALENSALAIPVGHWVLETACAQASRWRDTYACEFRVGVNLFGMQFEAGDVETTVRRVLADTGLPAHALELEITENIILNNDETMVSPLRRLRGLGVGVAFDDYGTGYASLSLLKRYPLSRLKIDRSFVRDLGANVEDRAVVSAVLYLGKSFNLKVIAEGVEDVQQLEQLRHAGCEEVQGYLMGKPVPAAEFERLFLQGQESAPS